MQGSGVNMWAGWGWVGLVQHRNAVCKSSESIAQVNIKLRWIWGLESFMVQRFIKIDWGYADMCSMKQQDGKASKMQTWCRNKFPFFSLSTSDMTLCFGRFYLNADSTQTLTLYSWTFQVHQSFGAHFYWWVWIAQSVILLTNGTLISLCLPLYVIFLAWKPHLFVPSMSTKKSFS